MQIIEKILEILHIIHVHFLMISVRNVKMQAFLNFKTLNPFYSKLCFVLDSFFQTRAEYMIKLPTVGPINPKFQNFFIYFFVFVFSILFFVNFCIFLYFFGYFSSLEFFVLLDQSFFFSYSPFAPDLTRIFLYANLVCPNTYVYEIYSSLLVIKWC